MQYSYHSVDRSILWLHCRILERYTYILAHRSYLSIENIKRLLERYFLSFSLELRTQPYRIKYILFLTWILAVAAGSSHQSRKRKPVRNNQSVQIEAKRVITSRKKERFFYARASRVKYYSLLNAPSSSRLLDIKLHVQFSSSYFSRIDGETRLG